MINLKIYKNLKDILKNLQKKSFIIMSILMVFALFMEIVILKFIYILLNSFTNQHANQNGLIYSFIEKINLSLNFNFFIIALLFFVLFFKTILNLFINWKKANFIFKTKEELSKRFLEGYLFMPRIFHMRVNTSELIKNITTEVDSLMSSLLSLSNIVLEIILLIGLSIFLLFFNLKATLICLILFIFFSLLISKLNSKKTIKLGKERVLIIQKRLKNIIEALTGSKTFALTGARDKAISDFDQNNERLADVSVETFFRNTVPKPLFEVFTGLVITVFLLLVIDINTDFSQVVPTLGVFLTASYRLIPSFSNLMSNIQGFQYSIQSLDNLSKDEKKFKNINKNLNFENFEFKKNIHLEKISFSYQPEEGFDKKLLLSNIDLKINKGSKVGIIGDSGSGKSTLIDLIMGLLPLEKGQIIVDKKNINKNLQGWQKNISCVPQEVFILDDSLKKNIAFGLDEKKIDIEKVKKVLKEAGLENFLQDLENNLNTVIGERGERVSGGQKQRIGIARALYFEPELLIFDESTSSLDKKTEEKIINEIFKQHLKKTILFISHNIENLKYCNEIYKIENKNLIKIK
jgi:ATP-binding cassette, subfamily B, bacterial PglK